METGLGASRLSKSGWVLDQHDQLCCPEGQEAFVSQDLTQVSGVTQDACRAQRTGQKNHEKPTQGYVQQIELESRIFLTLHYPHETDKKQAKQIPNQAKQTSKQAWKQAMHAELFS